ncbi:ATP-binding protein [Paenibacillus timonensis]|uniref:ATP-binding protein n=1 Tax=Paenibacillus timonensis TaxID=225915 RepID=UPI003F9B2A81
MSQSSTYKIRPAGRHILTIGEELIQDKFAAIIELVKNAYDADSPDATIYFTCNQSENLFEIKIEDNGHGMSTDDVKNKWLVPSTSYKFREKKSPRGRIMQGRKGIGRYAASILGDDLLLETVDGVGEKTKIYVEWEKFKNYEYLDQVDITINSERVNEKAGTCLTISNSYDKKNDWDTAALNKLRFELKKLIPPKADNIFEEPFKISLCFDNFFEDQDKVIKEDISPYPILDLYDYKISGDISNNGIGHLIYENQKIRNGVIEKIDFNCGETLCGNLKIDIRVYDRDKDAIDQLINRGLKDKNTGMYLSKLQARYLLNEVNGIGVYRNGFRIRPLGDSDFDWLKLNEQRIQNPSQRIGSNQVVGYVHIESEELSNLEEKSARDGLKSNIAYERLKEITLKVIAELEQRRYVFRRNLGLSTPGKKIEKDLEEIFDYTSLKKSVTDSLKSANLTENVIEEVINIITKEQTEKNQAIEEIKRAVAVYQGQATLGKIVNIILHEGRRPLNYFKNQIPNLHFYTENFKTSSDDFTLEKIVHLASGITENASVFVNLFGRLDPLSAKRRDTKAEFLLSDTFLGIKSVFENELNLKNINITINCPNDLKFKGWRQDFYTIFTNLIDNSIFWIDEGQSGEREIKIEVVRDNENWTIDYTDSGPGIDPKLLESGVIFEPQFTTKPNGTGLGLSIAGEAADRNGLSLIALQNEKGVHFQLSKE